MENDNQDIEIFKENYIKKENSSEIEISGDEKISNSKAILEEIEVTKKKINVFNSSEFFKGFLLCAIGTLPFLLLIWSLLFAVVGILGLPFLYLALLIEIRRNFNKRRQYASGMLVSLLVMIPISFFLIRYIVSSDFH